MKKIVYTQEHSNFIEQAVQNVYDKVFSRNNLIQPTIKDVRKELMILEDNNENAHDKKIIHEMVNCLYSYTDGVYDMFAYPSDVDISTYRLVAFGLKNVDEKLLAASNDINYVLPLDQDELQSGAAESYTDLLWMKHRL